MIHVYWTQTAVGPTEQYSVVPICQLTSSERFKMLQYHLFYKIMRFRIQNTNVLLFGALYGYKNDFLLEGKNTNCKHLRTRQANYVKRNTEVRSSTIVATEKQYVLHILSVYLQSAVS
jgi:hypothetical protein